MKKTILTILITLAAVGCATAQRSSEISLRVGQHKVVAGRLIIIFLEVTDDSRCPAGKTCVWAGNAKVKISLSVGRKRANEFDLNSTTEPTSIEYAGYRISFISLTRKTNDPGAMMSVRPALGLKIIRIKH